MLLKPDDFRSAVFPGLPPEGALRRVALTSPGAMFLDSSMKQSGHGEHDILLLDPAFRLILPCRKDTLYIEAAGKKPKKLSGHPFEVIEGCLKNEPNRPPLFPPLLAGYISYEAGRFAERMPAARKDGPNLPDIYFICPKTVVIADSTTSTTIIHSAGDNPDDVRNRIWTSQPNRPQAALKPRSFGDVQSSLPLEPYLAAVERTIEYIRAGDIFQANLTRQLFIDDAPSPASVYESLSQLSPAPYSAWIDLGKGNAVLSSSMELFLRVRGRDVITRPIKGTVRRGSSDKEDLSLQSSLQKSEKDLAELTMIIDLERNDLGRVCEKGQVTVPDLYVLESFPHVHHLVSTVRGRLRDGVGIGTVLKAALPGGSITGAPKVRAMEIIRKLEPMRRNVYTGAIGWMDSAGNAEFNVAIRTITMEGGRAWFPAGGGIVADSVPMKEYEETLHKARGMALALGIDWPSPGDGK
jgi:para-aminobenzoate synthetase component 1